MGTSRVSTVATPTSGTGIAAAAWPLLHPEAKIPRASVRTAVGEVDLPRRKDRRRLVPFSKIISIVIALTFQSFPCRADCQFRLSESGQADPEYDSSLG